jgi:hypothetical protein
MTVLDLIKRSMRLLGALNVGDPPTNEEAQDGLTALNALVEGFATERLLMFTSTRQLFNLTSGKQVYAIGPGAVSPDWTAARPEYIDAAGLILFNSDPSQVIERPITVLRTDREWAAIRAKSLSSDLPTKLFYDHGYSASGAGLVALWPNPSAANQIALYTPTAVSQFTALTQTISLPPGYARMLPYNLAVEWAPEFDKEPSQVIVAVAMESKANVKRANVAITPLRMDLPRGDRGGSWDYQLGE